MDAHGRRTATRALRAKIEGAIAEQHARELVERIAQWDAMVAERDKRIAELELELAETKRRLSADGDAMVRLERTLELVRKDGAMWEAKCDELGKVNCGLLQQTWDLQAELELRATQIRRLEHEDRDAAKLRRRLREKTQELEHSRRQLNRWQGAVRQACLDGRIKSDDAMVQEAQVQVKATLGEVKAALDELVQEPFAVRVVDAVAPSEVA